MENTWISDICVRSGQLSRLPFIRDTCISNILCADLLLVSCPDLAWSVETPEFPIFACDLMSCPGLPFIGDTWIFNILCADLLLVSCPADLPSLVTPGFLIFVCDPSLGTPVFPIFYVRFTTGELCRSSLDSGKHICIDATLRVVF